MIKRRSLPYRTLYEIRMGLSLDTTSGKFHKSLSHTVTLFVEIAVLHGISKSLASLAGIFVKRSTPRRSQEGCSTVDSFTNCPPRVNDSKLKRAKRYCRGLLLQTKLSLTHYTHIVNNSLYYIPVLYKVLHYQCLTRSIPDTCSVFETPATPIAAAEVVQEPPEAFHHEEKCVSTCSSRVSYFPLEVSARPHVVLDSVRANTSKQSGLLCAVPLPSSWQFILPNWY